MMTPVVVSWVIPILAFIAYVAIALLVFFLRPMPARFRFHACLYFALLGPVIWMTITTVDMTVEPPILRLGHGLGILGGLVLGYLIFYGLLDRSLSVRINQHLVPYPDGVSIQQILRDYRQDHSIERRFQIMVENGLLEKNGGLYRATPKGKHIARRVGFLKRLFSIGLGG